MTTQDYWIPIDEAPGYSLRTDGERICTDKTGNVRAWLQTLAYDWSKCGGVTLYKHRVMAKYIYDLDIDGLVVDHLDGDTKNNSRDNLRVCTQSQNNMNRSLSSNNKSGITGVHWHRASGKWRATIKVDRRERHLGLFKAKYHAIKARIRAEQEIFGEHSLRASRPSKGAPND